MACDKLTTDLRHGLFRVNRTYNSLTTLKSCPRPVVSLSHATKSYRVNRPLEYKLKPEQVVFSLAQQNSSFHKLIHLSFCGVLSLNKCVSFLLTNILSLKLLFSI